MGHKIVSRIAFKRDGSSTVRIQVDFAGAEHAETFLAAAGKRRMRRVYAAIRAVAVNEPDRSRDRSGEIQPKLPRGVREVLRTAAEGKRCTSHALLRRWLERYIDFDKGKRRPGKRKGRFKGPANSSQFRQTGREMCKSAEFVRMTFDAGSEDAKLAIERLAKATQLTISQFFAALIQRRSEEQGHRAKDSLGQPESGT